MKKPAKFLAAVSLMVISLSSLSSDAHAEKQEKCFGVVLAGENDCAAKDGSHSCATYAKNDGQPNEWIMLPEGVCKRIVGGMVDEEEDK